MSVICVLVISYAPPGSCKLIVYIFSIVLRVVVRIFCRYMFDARVARARAAATLGLTRTVGVAECLLN